MLTVDLGASQTCRRSLWKASNRDIAVVGGMMQPQGLHLKRWRVADFPTEDQFGAMGAEEVG
jgi:hypothetical protein